MNDLPPNNVLPWLELPPPPTFSLGRYWMAADLMRRQFHERRKAHESPETFILDTDGIAWMGLWYGALYVVVEGWQELELHDEQIDELLKSPNTDLLRRYRNGMFHYQADPFDDRFVDFMNEPSTPGWVAELHAAFGKWFEEVMKRSFGGELPEWLLNVPQDHKFPEWLRKIRALAVEKGSQRHPCQNQR